MYFSLSHQRSSVLEVFLLFSSDRGVNQGLEIKWVSHSPTSVHGRTQTRAMSLWSSVASSCYVSMLLVSISSWTICFWFFPFSMFLCREMGNPPSREGQWLDTELQGKQEAHTKQPDSQAACLLTLDFVILPTCLRMSSSIPEMVFAMTFPCGFLRPLGRPAREPQVGSHRHIDQRWWVINISYSHKIFAG